MVVPFLQDRHKRQYTRHSYCTTGCQFTLAELASSAEESVYAYMASKMAAMPWPPPIHILTRAYLPPMRLSSYRALTTNIQPVAPIGWPREMPLPFGFVRSNGKSRSRITARA